MAASSEYRVKVIMEVEDKTSGPAKQAKKGIFGLSSAVKQMATAFTVAAAAKFASELFQLGVAAEAAEHRFTQFAGGADKASDFLDAFNKGTDGAVDRMTAMSAASSLLQMGLASTTDEMEQIAGMAVKLGKPTEDASARIENFSLMLANQALPRLDSFGINSGIVRDRINELVASGEALNREEAFKMATMEEGTKALAILGDTTQTTAHKMDVAKAGWEDTKLALGQVAVAVADLTGVLDTAPTFMRAFADEMQAVANHGLSLEASLTGLWAGIQARFSGASPAEAAIAAMAAKTEALTGETEKAVGAMDSAERSYTAMAKAAGGAAPKIQLTAEQTEKLEKAAQKAAGAHADLAESLMDATDAAVAHAAISQLKTAMDAGTISTEDFSAAVEGIQLEFGLADKDSIALAQSVTGLVAQFTQGKIKAGELDNALRRVSLAQTRGASTGRELGQSLTAVKSKEEAATASAERYTAARKKSAEAAKASAVAQAGLAASLKDATHAEIAQAAIGELGRALSEGKINFQTYSTAVGETQKRFGLADDTSIALAEGLMRVTDSLAKGTIKATEFDDALMNLIATQRVARDESTIFVDPMTGPNERKGVSGPMGGLPSGAAAAPFSVGPAPSAAVATAGGNTNTYNNDTYNVMDNSAMAAVQENQRRDKRASYMRTN